MTTNSDMERQFQERIARAQEAARLASIAAMARGASSDAPPAPRGPAGPALGFRGPPRGPPPPIPDAVRHRIDRLVEFIARNGPAFEATARERERDNPDFAFLHAGAPFHDYFVWRKSQATTPAPTVVPPPPHAGLLPMPPRPLASPTVDPVMSLSVGAMANACKAARARGLPPYAPLPPDLLAAGPSAAPPVEPARLEARLAEFYRSPLSS